MLTWRSGRASWRLVPEGYQAVDGQKELVWRMLAGGECAP